MSVNESALYKSSEICALLFLTNEVANGAIRSVIKFLEILWASWSHIGNLKSAMVGVFTLWKLGNTRNPEFSLRRLFIFTSISPEALYKKKKKGKEGIKNIVESKRSLEKALWW